MKSGKPLTWQQLSVRAVKVVKIAILLGIVVQTLLPDILPISEEPLLLRIAGTLIYTVGLWIAICSRKELGDNWSDIEAARIGAQQFIVRNGPYRFIRHPIYVGDLMLLVGLELALNSWLLIGILLLIPVVLMQAVREEEKLIRSLPDYAAYCSSTKRFIPFVI
ncbi:MAG: isoprenylcysteine carboxylmethyltransferase family protein [Pyrinomonadaceae bacterium]|nr:isoprenylcysteine carboxylmethyltransferase family protein [Pyrinomonadaceae bacterium]